MPLPVAHLRNLHRSSSGDAVAADMVDQCASVVWFLNNTAKRGIGREGGVCGD